MTSAATESSAGSSAASAGSGDAVPTHVRRALVVASALGGLGVALGAFGAHALKGALEGAADAAQRLTWWDTATRYQLWHALLCGLLARYAHHPRARAGIAFCVVGTALFSGSLYAMTLTNVRALGAITPLGGLSFMAAWACLASSAGASSATRGA